MLVLVTLIFSMGFTVWAVDSPTPKVWVVSIGVGKYTRNFAALRTAADGARKIALAISDVNRDVTTSYTLTTDAPEDINRPTKENVLQIFADLERQVRPNDRVIVYFCGHGVEFKEKPYLLLMNVTDIKDEELLATGSLSVSWLRDKLNGLKCKERLLWLDACRVEVLEASGDGDDGTGDALPLTTAMSTGARMTASRDGIAVTYHGCRAGESVYYSKDGPSFFNKALVEGLQGKAADVHGRITMASLSRYVNDRVPVLVTEQNPALQQHPDIFPANIPDDALVLKSAPGYIAIPDFEGDFSELFAVTVYNRLAEAGEVNLVLRDKALSEVLKEIKLQGSSITEPAGAEKLGNMLNAKYILYGNTKETLDKNIIAVSMTLINLKAAQVGGVTASCKVSRVSNDYHEKLQALAEDLLIAMRKNGLTIKCVEKKPDIKIDSPTGSLCVTSDPSGAVVYIGGDKVDGVTPVTVKSLRPGQVTVMTSRDGYGDVTQEATIKSNEVTSFTVKLFKLQGAITIFSNPPGAKVMVDGEEHGVTTAIGRKIVGLSLGMHKLRVTLPNYREEMRDVLVVNGGNHPINISLIGLPGKVTISTSPKGARVQLDGVDSGKSLLTLINITPGSHKVRVNLVGYASVAKEFVLSPNDTQMMTFNLTPLEKVQIKVVSSPPGASIYINDKLQVEKTPTLFTLDEIGEELQDVKVEVRIKEYQPAIETIKIKAGDEKKNISFILKKGLAPTKINPKDGATMILIPAGEFLMGSTDADKLASDDEKPQRKVYLDTYYIYKTEVTVTQYRRFCTMTNREMPHAPEWGWKENHPVVNVSWNDANAYAEWAGAMLPTEAQWEKAARGGDGRIYPWGFSWDKTKCANYTNSYPDNATSETHPVGSFPKGASPYGVMDMSGNVWEWCADWYGANYYMNDATAKNPTGPATGENRVLRGGSWDGFCDGDYDGFLRAAFRYSDQSEGTQEFYFPYTYGFRCAYPVVQTPLIDTSVIAPSVTTLQHTTVNPKDDAEMILIPAGDFLMGSTDADKYAQDNEKQQHKVYLDDYYMYKTEVTVAQYRKFCTATNRAMPDEPDWKWQDTHPIVNVSWNDAKAYADWAGAALPTEAHWEKAARGGDGRVYPWGNTWDEIKCANYTNSGKGNTKYGTHPVGSFPTSASPYGVMDMSGNVYEWCGDRYSTDYDKNAQVKTVTRDSRVLRGGSWRFDIRDDYDDDRGSYRCAYRYFDYLGSCYNYIGFRCAVALPGAMSQFLTDPPAITPVKTNINSKDGAEMTIGESPVGVTDMTDNMAGSTGIGISDRGNIGVIAGGFSFGHDVGGKLMPSGNPSPGGRVNISDAPANGDGGNGDGRVNSSGGSGGVSYLAEISGISNIGKVPSIIEKENLLGRIPGKSCTIIVDVQVGSSGQAMDVTLVKSTVFNVLNNNAIYISRKIEYRPGMKNGVVCPTTIRLEIKYIDGKTDPEIKVKI